MEVLASLVLLLCSFGFLLRFLLEFHRANFYNPVVQGLVRFTDPPYRIVSRVVPRLGEWNLPLLLILLVLEALFLWLQEFSGTALTAVVLAAVHVVSRALDVYLVCLIVTVIASWIQFTGQAQPILNLVQALSMPLLNQVRRYLPRTGMLDFSPMLAVLALLVAQHFLSRFSIWISIRL